MEKRFQVWSKILNILVLLTGSLVLTGWIFEIDLFKRPLPHTVGMNPATAVAFICSSISLFLLTGKKASGNIFAVIVLLTGTIKFSGILFGFDAQVDHILFSSQLDSEVSGLVNRMAPNTAFCFILTGTGLLLMRFGTAKKIMASQFIALIIALGGLLSALGYTYKVESLSGILTYIPMAVHSAFSFLCFGVALLFTVPGKGLMKVFTTNYAGSVSARKFVPVAIIIPVLLGFLRIYTTEKGLMPAELGTSLVILGTIIIFLVYIYNNAVSLNKKDIKRNSLENELKNSNEKFLRLFYGSPLAMVIRRVEDGKILDVNEEYQRLLGFKKQELVGKTSLGVGMILDPEFSNKVSGEASGKKSLKNMEATLYNAKKEPINVIVSIEKIQLENKECIISALLDITERKKLEENLHILNKELESFTYSVSHDLRAPLRIINGYAQMIKEDGKTLSDEPKRMLENIMQNAKHMGTLIDDLLNFSRLGRKEPMSHDTDMNAVVQPILEQRLNGHSNYNVRLDNLPPCQCDSSLIKQVWENLISNAIKYSVKNPAPAIEIGSVKENDKTVYYIKDNGAGFDMKYYDKLFGVFQRLHKASEFEGTGVGLALTQRIISKHGGRIWAESKLNEGSTFYFTVCK